MRINPLFTARLDTKQKIINKKIENTQQFTWFGIRFNANPTLTQEGYPVSQIQYDLSVYTLNLTKN